MTTEKDKENREKLKVLINKLFKDEDEDKKMITEFIEKLENGRLEELLKKIKKRVDEMGDN